MCVSSARSEALLESTERLFFIADKGVGRMRKLLAILKIGGEPIGL